MSDEDTKVVSLAAKRHDRIDNPKEGDKAPPGYEQVRLIACSNCQSGEWVLTHDNRIACAKCKVIGGPLRWYDVNLPLPAPPAA